MLKAMIKPLIFGLVCFFAGYKIAVLTQSPSLISTANEQTDQGEKTPQASDDYAVLNQPQRASIHTLRNNDAAKLINTDLAETVDADELSERLVRDDLDAMLARLEELRAEGSNNELVAIQYDLLKGFLIENPENIENLLGQLSSHSINSGPFDTLLSLLKALPIEETERVRMSFAEQYAGAIDYESQAKLLAVLSTSYEPIESAYLTRSLVDMAMSEQTDIDSRLEALSLVKSHQLEELEKANIINQLNQLASTTSDHELARLVPHLMRFSKKDQRVKLATELLLQSSSEPARNEVLSGINSGSIPKSDDLKAMLFEIVADPNDVLSQEAAETLEYSFELSRQEYAQLNAHY